MREEFRLTKRIAFLIVMGGKGGKQRYRDAS